MKFKLESHYLPAGDQPQAIAELISGLEKGMQKQTLLGATGTGKTYTVANIIEQMQKPTLVIAHNKTLAAQLAQEFKEFFPNNAVHYFVSYYDYYQPEAYLPTTDTYIEKDASINEEIDRLRHASTQSLLTRNDVIVVASVSCIYGLGSPKEYEKRNMRINVGDTFSRTDFVRALVDVHYKRTNADVISGEFRVLGNAVEMVPVSQKTMLRIEFTGSAISRIREIDPVSSVELEEKEHTFIFPAKHFLTDKDQIEHALKKIETELAERLHELEEGGKMLEAERLKRRTTYDIAMIREIGYTNGIENYSRHLSGRAEGEPAETLMSYFPHDEKGNPQFLTFIDESHVTIPQLHAMYAGDRARKKNLIEYGFRLPSAIDNRPMQFHEFEERVGQQIYVSATPSNFEREHSEQIVEQIIRPTGLVDPMIEIRPVTPSDSYNGQVQDFITEVYTEVKKGGRVIATTLTKKMAEDLSEYLKEKNIKAEYLHSEIKTIERIKILTQFRKGEFDCLVGVNLLREGLDMPEVTLIGILDADKEGFLRSETSLIQTIGRAARNVDGRVILYADRITNSMEKAIGETTRRRDKQLAYNKMHGITPKTIIKEIKDITEQMESQHERTVHIELDTELAGMKKLQGKKREMALKKLITKKEKEMNGSVKILDFETAAILRDEILALQNILDAKK
ncbi:MAG: excinuclease ABC subunit UvrB [Candidatus Pacebacteria bacterium]|nr:excinuclease ABC subunit UvrB [Candidatus Paceibacterota bacterium]